MTFKNKALNVRIGIIRNEKANSADDWIRACENKGLDYYIVDLSENNWLDKILGSNVDFYVTQPPGTYERFKTLFDERLYIITNDLKLRIFPFYAESLIYENKKMLSYYLKSHNIPHPKTCVFYNDQEAITYVEQADLPIVAKTNIGASGAGVKIIRSKQKALSYINLAFHGRGIKRRFGPNRVTGSPQKWATQTITSPGYFLKKLKYYLEINRNAQYGYVIFQEYVPHEFEWRVVKVGESLFAHKKMKVEDKASGGKVKQFGFPPNDVLDYVDKLCQDNGFQCVCVDLFEHGNAYLINEIQCVFGIPYGYLSKVGDDIGRFIKRDGKWNFENGDFTVNNCCDLKLETAIKLFMGNDAII